MDYNMPGNSGNGIVELKEYWALSNQIIELAGKGYPRQQFLKDVIQHLLRITGCDVIELVFRDSGRQFSCRAGREERYAFQFKQEPILNSDIGLVRWSYGNNDAVENLCRDIINRRFDQTLPGFTQNGSFWTTDIDRLTFFGELQEEATDALGINIDRDFKSVVIFPIDIGHERIGLLEFKSRAIGYFDIRQVNLLEPMGRTIGIALTHRQIHIALRERAKELTCLYGIAKLVQRPNITLDNVLQEAVKLLPPACLYPDIASAQIVFNNRVYTGPNIEKIVHSMKADIVVDDQKCGFLEIRYAEERPPLDDGPFLREERRLFEAIAQELSLIIEQFQAEKKNINLQEQLLHADRLATIGQLVAGVTHELNEPLANILGFAQLAMKAPDLSDQVKSDLDKIIVSALHSREVIQKLLMSARGTRSTKERFDINSLITDGLSFLKSRCLKSGIELVCNLGSGIPQLTADRSQMIQVMTNLVVNAIQSMPFGGRLVITTKREKEKLVITIADTGTGIEDKVMGKIFDPFFTTKGTDQGTGLGLPIARNIISAHGGTITVQSEVGKGTTFTLILPLGSPGG